MFSAGDSVRWNKSLTDYSPDDGWTLTYAFRGEKGDGRLDVTATNDNGTHAIYITPAESNLMRPGLWVWAAYVTDGVDRYKIGQGTTRVEPNLAVTNFQTDLRTDAKKAYDNALDAWQKVSLGQTVSLNGRTYTQHNLDALTRWVDTCRTAYALEQGEKDHPGVNPRRILVSLDDRYK